MLRHRLAVLGAVVFIGFLVSSYIGSLVSFVCFAVCGAAALIILLMHKNRPAVLVLTGMTAAFLIYGAYSAVFIEPVSALYGTVRDISAEVLSVSSPDNDTVRVTCSGTAEGIPLRFTLFCPDIGISEGDTVAVSVKLSEPQTYAAYSGDFNYAHGIFVRASLMNMEVTGKREGISVGAVLREYSAYLRETVREHLPGEEGALMLAMCFGDKSRMTAELSDAVLRSGLSHMTAVSGMHISLMVTVLMSLLSLAGAGKFRVLRFCAAAVLAAVFMVFFDFSASVCRSGIMLIAGYGSVLFRRGHSPADALGAAALVILLTEPCACRDAGLILSVCGTLGAVSLAPKLETLIFRGGKVPKIAGSLIVAVCASWCTLPVSAVAFGKLSPVSALSSLAVYPMFFGVMTFALCIAFSGGLLAKAVLLPSGLLLKAMWAVMRFFAGSRYSAVSLEGEWLTPFLIVSAVFIALTAVLAARSRRRGHYGAAAAVLCAAALSGLVTAQKVHDSRITRIRIYSDGKDCLATVSDRYGVSAYCTAVNGKLSSAAYSMLSDLGEQNYILLCVMEEKKRGALRSESFDEVKALEKRYLDNTEKIYDVCGAYTAEVYEDAVILDIGGMSVSISDAAAADVYGGHDIGIYSGYKKSADCNINGITVMCDKRYSEAAYNACFTDIELLISEDGKVQVRS